VQPTVRYLSEGKEDIEGQSATRKEQPNDPDPVWIKARVQLLAHKCNAVLMEGLIVSEAVQEQLERLRFYQIVLWDVVDDDVGKVWLTCHRTQTRELDTGKPDTVECRLVLVVYGF
jgi:hypothetical protein